ncbi:MAG: type I restriction enzyme HsdR N-terminal domain-containing protein [Sediminibacterium sp.]
MLTPEEWVRQNFIQFLIQVKNYPAALIAIEKTIQLGELKKRFDMIVYKNDAPWILIECKEANVSLTEKTLEQILQYQQVVEANYLVMTNGHTTYGAKIETGKLHYLQSLPDYH